METLEINENLRYRIEYDTTPFDYLTDLDWDTWGLFSLATSRWTTVLELDTFGVNDRLRDITEWIAHSWNREDLENAIGKALSRAGYNYEFLNLNGSSQSYWAYVVVYWDPKLIDTIGLWDELKAWYRGDVYNVYLEQRTEYKSSDGRSIYEWDILDCIGGVIFHDSYEFNMDNCKELLGYAIPKAA